MASEEFQESFKRTLREFLRRNSSSVQRLDEICEYAALAGGKYARPRLILALQQLIEIAEPEDLSSLQVAVELLHTSTLVHDDLPSLDDDDYRRGRPATHVEYGEASAVLAGDALFALAVISSSQAKAGGNWPELVARTYQQICAGQLVDIEPDYRESIEELHRLKTATLFSLCGEIVVGLNAVEGSAAESIRSIASEFGRYFQLRDDYIDRYRDPSEKGRLERSDLKNEKETGVTESSRIEAERTLHSMHSELVARSESLAGTLGSGSSEMMRALLDQMSI